MWFHNASFVHINLAIWYFYSLIDIIGLKKWHEYEQDDGNA